MQVKKNKILILSSFIPPVNAGGGRNASYWGNFLAKRSYNVTLLSLNRKGELPNKECKGNLKIIRIYYFNKNIFTKIFSLIFIIPGYFIHIVRNHSIFIFGGNIIAYEAVIIFARIFNKKIVFQSTLIGDDDMQSIKLSKGALYTNFIFSKISLYHSLTSEFSRLWIKEGFPNKKIIEIPQGVDTTIFSPTLPLKKNKIRHELGLPLNIPIIITIGFLIDRKGFMGIFEALYKIKLPYLYIIIGDYDVNKDHFLWHKRDEMHKLFFSGKKLLKKKISFLGPINHPEQFLQASDIFILNSVTEGLPNVLLESMATGLACCFPKMNGIHGKITIHQETALLHTGTKEMEENISQLITRREYRHRLGTKARMIVEKQFSFLNVLQEFQKHDVL